MDFLKQGNIRAFKFGAYIACVIIALGIYNFFVKIYFDPCCQEHTLGEFLYGISDFLSYITGIAIIILIFLSFFKILIMDRFKKKKDISWRAEKESALNAVFITILIFNFCLLLGAQLPKVLIGCTGCAPVSLLESVKKC